MHHEDSALSWLDEQALERCVRRYLPKRSFLNLAGEREKRVHIVERGVLKLVARQGDGHESILGLAVRGDIVGDIAVLDDLPQPVDIVAATDCTLIGIDAEAFLSGIARTRSELAFAAALAAKLRGTYEAALERHSANVPAKLAGRLLHLADIMGEVDDKGIIFDLPIPQSDVARLAGMCRESACKTMRRFQRGGLIDYRGRTLRILRPDLLERIRCGARVARPSRSTDGEGPRPPRSTEDI